MKKIFSLFSALLLTVSMWGAYEYNATISGDVHVVNLSSGTQNKFRVDFKQVGISGQNSYTTYVSLLLLPDGNDIAGEYKNVSSSTSSEINNMDKSASYIYYASGSTNQKKRPIISYVSSEKVTDFVIEKNGNGTYTFSGTIRTKQDSKSNYWYYYYDAEAAGNTFDLVYDTYEEELLDGKSINEGSLYGSFSSLESPIILDLGSLSADENVTLQFNTEGDVLTAGVYPVASTGAMGTIQAGDGTFGGYYPNYSYYYKMDADYNIFYKFITGGSVEVSYSNDNSKITIAGTVTTGRGSTITINQTLDNPWYVPEPKTITMKVKSVTPNVQSNNFALTIEGKDDTPQTLYLYVNSSSITNFATNNVNLNYSYVYDGTYLDITTVNSMSIVSTGTADYWQVMVSVTCGVVTYEVTSDANATFYHHIVTPWDTETKVEDFTFTAAPSQLAYNDILYNNRILLNYEDANGNIAQLSFAAEDFTLPAAAYSVSENKTAGTLIASPGYKNMNNQPSFLLVNGNPLFIRSGEVSIAYSGDNDETMTISGDVTTYTGTKVTLNLTGVNPFMEIIDVESMTANAANNQLTFNITPASSCLTTAMRLIVNSPVVVGEFTYDKIDQYSYASNPSSFSYVDDNNQENVISVVRDQDVMKLSASITMGGIVYVIDDAEFMYSSISLSDAEDVKSSLEALMNMELNMTIQRTLYKDNCVNSICLPFSIANIEETPLAGATVYSMTDATIEGDVISFIFETVNAIEAGKPYLIKWPAGTSIVNPVFNNVTIEATEGVMVEGTNAKFIGILEPTVMDANSLFVGANNTVSYSNDENKEASLKGFRAYFQLSTMATAPKKACLVLGGNSAPTSILTPKAMKYNKVIENGQFVIIRNNVRINALGQTIR